MMSNPKIERLDFAVQVPGVLAFSTLRGEVVAADAYSEVNLCDYTGDDSLHVTRNRRALCEHLHILPDRLVMPRQSHTTRVLHVDTKLMSLPQAQRARCLQDVDALVTTLHGVCIGVNTADCVPLALVDPTAGVTAVAHAGWRGTVGRIAAETIAVMCQLGADPKRIQVSMGPSICPRCFEVGDEVVDQFAQAGFPMSDIVTRPGKAHIDLQRANRFVLEEAGVRPDRITWSGHCSHCALQRYFSARAAGIHSGRTFTAIFRQ